MTDFQILQKFVTLRLFLITVFSIFLLSACESENKSAKADYSIIPLPQQVILQSEKEPFILDKSTKILYIENDNELYQLATFLSAYVKECVGIELQLTTKDEGENSIKFQIDDVMDANPDYYNLSITNNHITIEEL